jgi:oxygen-independent coproporphyrinogen-3 oxidase
VIVQESGIEPQDVAVHRRGGQIKSDGADRAGGIFADTRQREYLGIGPGAHSFSGDDRRWCSSSAREYSEGRITFEHETLTTIDHLNEYIMTSLRRCEGIDLEHITRCYGATEALRIADGAEAWLSQGILKKQGSHLAIPTDKFLLSDAVIESLFA